MLSHHTWEHLLQLKYWLRDHQYTNCVGYLYYNNYSGFGEHNEVKKHGSISQSKDSYNSRKISDAYYYNHFDDIDHNSLELFCNYLEILFLPFDQKQRSSVITHVAQSIDGKMATKSGHSQWIGNTKNQVHSHRVRALVDGVLVGTGTLIHDRPQLTVRHVNGKSPQRFFWSNSINQFDEYKTDEAKTTLIRDKNTTAPQGVNEILYYNGEMCNEEYVLTQLKQRGIHTLLVEGGANTINHFMKSKCIDLLQVHIAPIVLGSGKSPFKFSGTTTIDEALTLDGYFMHVDDHMMFTGKIK